MLITLILLYLAIQFAAAWAISRTKMNDSLRQIAIVALMLASYLWAHYVNVAAIYKFLPAKFGVVFYNPLPLILTCIFALLIANQTRRIVRIAVYTTLWLLVNGYFFSPAFYNPVQCQDRWDGICCLQTTDSTCAAAASATLLKLHDIPTTEDEMKNRCMASTHGTSFEGIYLGLAEMAELRGKRIDVDILTFDDFIAKNENALVLLMLNDELDKIDHRYSRDWGWIVGTVHSVVFLGKADENHVWIADPGTGLEKWKLEGLRNLWRDTALFVR